MLSFKTRLCFYVYSCLCGNVILWKYFLCTFDIARQFEKTREVDFEKIWWEKRILCKCGLFVWDDQHQHHLSDYISKGLFCNTKVIQHICLILRDLAVHIHQTLTNTAGIINGDVHDPYMGSGVSTPIWQIR